jgi:hypothetical protein
VTSYAIAFSNPAIASNLILFLSSFDRTNPDLFLNVLARYNAKSWLIFNGLPVADPSDPLASAPTSSSLPSIRIVDPAVPTTPPRRRGFIVASRSNAAFSYVNGSAAAADAVVVVACSSASSFSTERSDRLISIVGELSTARVLVVVVVVVRPFVVIPSSSSSKLIDALDAYTVVVVDAPPTRRETPMRCAARIEGRRIDAHRCVASRVDARPATRATGGRTAVDGCVDIAFARPRVRCART